MKTLQVLIAVLLIGRSSAEEPHPFSGKWHIVEESHVSVYKKDGVELALKTYEFRGDKKCVLHFESATGVLATIDHRFVAGFEELVLIKGENQKNTSVEVYSWSLRGGELVLVQNTVVGGPDSDPPDTTELDDEAADLLMKLSKIPKKLTIRLRLKRAEQDGADQPSTAVESKVEGEEKPKTESEGRSQ